jgi:phosphoglycerate dehydrogenase-like enzyme
MELTGAQRARIERAAPGAQVVARACRSSEEMLGLAAGGCDVVLTFRVPDDLIARVPGLKWVQLLSAGADHALAGGLKGCPVPVTTASGVHATPIAEYTIASMLAWAHRIHQTTRAQVRHEWARRGLNFMSLMDVLRGKTLGVIGYGSIGRETARLARAFGMRIVALKRDPENVRDEGWCPAGLGDPDGIIPARFYGPAARLDMIAESDYILVTLPGTRHTEKFIGAEEIAAMKPSAYIVNVGRGKVIDQNALIAALKAKKIGGAGLDVFEVEPLPADSDLWDCEEAILTPHVSGDFREYFDVACELFADNLARFCAGKPLLNRVDPEAGY